MSQTQTQTDLLNAEVSAELSQMAEAVVNKVKAAGASAAAVFISKGQGFNVTVRKGDVETLEHNADKSMDVVAYFGQRKGLASTSDFSMAAVDNTVQAACHIAEYMAEDACVGLAEADRMATAAQQQIHLDLYHPSGLTPAQGIERAKSCESIGLDHDKRITNTEGATFATMEGVSVIANSHGFVGVRHGTRHDLSLVLVASSDGKMQRDYGYSTARDVLDMVSDKQVAIEAAQRTVARLGARILSTRRAPVMLTPEIARGLLGHLVGAVSGGNLYREASFLLNAADTKVFSDCVTLHEMPHLKKGLASRVFDDEGVATEARDLVHQGRLTGYVLGSYSARRLGLTTTANAGGIHNLVIEPGTRDFDAMLAELDTGFLVTDVMGQGVNLLTGDYSRGAAGFWVEGGVIQYPVDEVTIAGNLREMFQNIVAVGNDLDWRSRLVTGSLLIDSMMIAGK